MMLSADVTVCPRFLTEPKQKPSDQRGRSSKRDATRRFSSFSPILELMQLGHVELTRGDLLKKETRKKKKGLRTLEEFSALSAMTFGFVKTIQTAVDCVPEH